MCLLPNELSFVPVCRRFPAAPTARHLDAAPSDDYPAHCNHSQPGTHTHTHTEPKHSHFQLLGQHLVCLSVSLAGPIEQNLYRFSAVLSALSFPPLCSCLMCAPPDKRHTSSPPFTLFIFVSFPLSLFSVERETVNRRLLS